MSRENQGQCIYDESIPKDQRRERRIYATEVARQYVAISNRDSGMGGRGADGAISGPAGNYGSSAAYLGIPRLVRK